VLGNGAIKRMSGGGESLYLAGQTYDPNGELYTANGFLVSQGTSFSTPQVAGIAALVKQSLSNLRHYKITRRWRRPRPIRYRQLCNQDVTTED